jgi:hypothetical protein
MNDNQTDSSNQGYENSRETNSGRRDTVNPQEGNIGLGTTAPRTPRTLLNKNTSGRKPPLPPASERCISPKVRPTRASASRLALEETDDDDRDTRPMQLPQREDGIGANIHRTAPESRAIARTVSSSDCSFGSVPMPPALEFQLTDPISNTTPGVRTRSPSYQALQAAPAVSTPAQPYDSTTEEAFSSRSNSMRSSSTEGTIGTLDLVLAKRYAAYYGGNYTGTERIADEKSNPRIVDRTNQILLDEKQRQANGYVSQDMEQYTSTATLPDTFEDEHDDEESQDASLSTTPDPPSLRLRGHYLRPGAYRMRQGEEGRHVDNDSIASSSLRTFSTFRTNIANGIIEASLVDDENTIQGNGMHPEDEVFNDCPESNKHNDVAVTVDTFSINYHDSSNGHEYVVASSRSYDMDEDDDCEIPSVPDTPATARAVSCGGMTLGSSCSHVVEAQLIDERSTVRFSFQRRHIRCMMCILSLVFFLLMVGTVYAVTGFVFNGQRDRPYGDISAAPTTEGDLQLDYFVRVALPEYTRDALREENSPQTKALQWLQNNSNLESYPLVRRLQRFALATLFFSTGGDRRWNNNSGWLSDENECNWFSSESLPCREGNLTLLALRNNALRGTISPEISLLSSLEILRVQENILTGFLPTTLGELVRLKEIRLCK